MAWFIVAAERKTQTKFLVEAADEAEVDEKGTDGEYFGYVDGENERHQTYGPFPTCDAALEDIVSYVEGR